MQAWLAKKINLIQFQLPKIKSLIKISPEMGTDLRHSKTVSRVSMMGVSKGGSPLLAAECND